MMSKKLEKFYIWGIKAAIFAIPLLPLYVSTSMIFPFITGKNFAFRILTEVAAVLWLGLAVLNKEYRLRNSTMLLLILAFTFVVGVANLSGVNPYNSFWSSYERMEGYLTILHLCLYFMILKSILRTRKDWMIFFSIFVVGSVLVSLFAIYQKFGPVEIFRVSSMVGSPAFLASYLLLVVFLGLILAFKTQKPLLRYVYLLSVVLNSVVIYFTATRGVILAGIVGVMLFSLFYIFVKQNTVKRSLLRKFALMVFIVAVILSVAFWTFKDTDFIRQNRVFTRFATMFSDPSVTFRLVIWEMAWDGVKERPVLGWGQENFMVVYTKYFNPEVYGLDVWADRVHNIVLDWLTNAGFLGLFFYLSIFGAVFWSLWLVLRRELISTAEGITITTALVAYFIQNLFIFDTISTYIIFFALLAYVDSYNVSTEEIKGFKAEDSRASEFFKLKIKSVSVTLFALVTFCFTAYFINYKPIKESQQLQHIIVSWPEYRSFSEMLDDFNKALAYKTFGDTDVRLEMARVSKKILASKRFTEEGAIKLIQATTIELEKQVAANPGNLEYLSFFVNFLNDIARYEPSFIEKAEFYIKEAMRLNSNNQWVYFALADNFLIKKDYENAFLAVKKAVELEPKKIGPQLKLVLAAILTSREDLVDSTLKRVKEFRAAKDKDVAAGKKSAFFDYELLVLAHTSMTAENFKLAHRFYKELIAVSPNNAEYHFEIAKIYRIFGDEVNAIKEAKKAAELDPLKYADDVEEFIRQLKGHY